MPSARVVVLRDEAATLSAAAALAARLEAPMVVALSGPLGAGKTTFVRGVLNALGHRGVVSSPTFAMINEYRRLKPRVYHMDLYRAESADLPGLALDEYLADDQAVCLIEWPEVAAPQLPGDRIEAALEHAPEGRLITLRGTGPRARAALRGGEL
ncbi:MAG: tRNA (adenosine(37)-N6)-threonylcarbamoyltransferase complex ATPase subunit type 1 TsaE [Elusimicrobia bacterium]|nr:tRNA (adenosine(37)-N6)-threonylcarbamoyltransferase complex ATPase subunit type 1 TsaE [Elusimicrobiota bacterium]